MAHLSRLWLGTSILSILAVAGAAHADELTAEAKNDLVLTPFVDGITLPTGFAFLPDKRLVVTSQNTGEIFIVSADGKEKKVAGKFKVQTHSIGERGLLNVIVHPQFAQNRILIVYYSAAPQGNKVVSVQLGADDTFNAAQEKVLLSDANTSDSNHNGGGLAISKDGQYLFIGSGDTGCNRPKPGNLYATCLDTTNGKILRINIDGGIPADNPLTQETAITACKATQCSRDGDPGAIASAPTAAPRKEIWAWGFRNPWRISVDPVSGFLWVGDVGENAREEITLVKGPKEHHGYPFFEGTKDHYGEKCSSVKPSTPCTKPIYDWAQPSPGNTSAIGGVVVDHCSWPEKFNKSYFFGEYAGSLSSFKLNGARDGMQGEAIKVATMSLKQGPISFALGPDGGLYYSNIAGRINRIGPKNPGPCGGGGGGGGSAGTAGTGGGPTTGGSSGTGGVTPTGGKSGTGATGPGTGGSPPTTGGSSGKGGSGNVGGGSNPTGGAGGAPPSGGGQAGSGTGGGAGKTDGCGCRVAGGKQSAALGLLGLGALSVLWSRRRKYS